MAILSGDIKLLKSAVMLDVPEGGGAPTGSAIVDAVSNAVFPDISELDRALGRVNLRKVFVSVETSDTDGYFGSNVIVAEPPADPRVSVTLFSTGNTFDRRAAAQNRIEAYLALGPAYPGYLFGNCIAGMASITLLQRAEVAPPVVGDTLVLRAYEGTGSQVEQFVRVTDVTTLLRTFADAQGDFQRLQVSLDISDTLRYDFPGFDALRLDASINYVGKTKTYSTIVADAARYYGVVPLDESAVTGDYGAKAQDIFTQIVPSTRVEVPIADARLNQQSLALVSAGQPYVRAMGSLFTTTQAMYIGGSILPGSLSVTRGGVTVTDRGGRLLDGTNTTVGAVDYGSGVLTLSSPVFGTGSGTFTVTYQPAMRPITVTTAIAEPVTAQGQRLSYAVSFTDSPVRGTLQVHFRSQGRWYVLSDDGSGDLRGGDSSFGAGTMNYGSGTANVTLGALPDVESYVIFTYASASTSIPVQNLQQAGSPLPRAFGKVVTVGQPIDPGTISLTWNDGTARSSTDVGGTLTGAATGTVNYATGEIVFRPNVLPAKDTVINLSISTLAGAASASVLSFTDGGATHTFDIGDNVEPRSVEMALVGQYVDWESRQIKTSIRVFDDGAGNLLTPNGTGTLTVGTVDYSTGACAVSKSVSGYSMARSSVRTSAWMVGPFGGGGSYETTVTAVPTTLTFLNGASAFSVPAAPWGWWGGAQVNAVEYRCASGASSATTYPFTLDALFMPNNQTAYSNVSGHAARLVSFNLGSGFYVKQDSTWVRDVNPQTGVGVACGADAVVGGVAGVQLSTWPAGVTSAPTNVAGATAPTVTGIDTPLRVNQAVFRTAVSPLLPGAFQIAGNWLLTGVAFSVSANSAGVISSGGAPADADSYGSLGVFGVVDYDMGVCQVYFGQRAGANLHAADGVIDISYLDVPSVTHIKIAFAQADTLRYNAVGYSYLPLDAGVLGMDPVRLPPDGRVPIFRPGSLAVLGHTGTVAPATYVNGDVVNCGRTRLSRVRLIDDNGSVVSTGYAANLDAGTVSITNVAGWNQPITVEHRIEDMMLVSDAQINGQLTFTRPVTHDYPAPGSYVSSALVGGDLQARVSVMFDQQTWTGVWSDAVIGSAATGTYNNVANPLVVTNSGALTERWALQFTSSSAFNVVGENVGVIAVGSTNTPCAPVNPATGEPYFTIDEAGWGLGWATGNVLRFNTVGAGFPVWVARTVLQGPETVPDDTFTLLIRGDVDRP